LYEFYHMYTAQKQSETFSESDSDLIDGEFHWCLQENNNGSMSFSRSK